MRTVRQPTLKTWLLLAGVSSALLASQVAFRSEITLGLRGEPADLIQAGVPLLATVGTWLLPFILPLWIKSSLRIGIACGLLHLLVSIVIVVCLLFIDVIVDDFVDRYIAFDLFLLIAFTLSGCVPITDWLLGILSIESSMLMLALTLFVGIVGYGVTCYFIAESFRTRQSG
jgi:hypothetical protein